MAQRGLALCGGGERFGLDVDAPVHAAEVFLVRAGGPNLFGQDRYLMMQRIAAFRSRRKKNVDAGWQGVGRGGSPPLLPP